MLQIICTLLPLGLLTLLIPFVHKRLPAARFRQAAWLIFLVYLAGNLYFTLLSRIPNSGTVMYLTPFRSYSPAAELNQPELINSTGFVKWFLEGVSPIISMFLNILLYYPMGYLLPVLFPRLKIWQIVLIGCIFSVLTELTQYLMAMGWCEIDDVLHNVLGTALGAVVYRWQSRKMSI